MIEPFLGAAAVVILLGTGTEGFLRPWTVARDWGVRAEIVLDPLGDAIVKLGFSGLGVLERVTRPCERGGGAILELILPFKPTLDGVLRSVPGVRPRTGRSSMAGN